MAKRGRPAKQQEPEQEPDVEPTTTPTTGYSITKPGDQYVVWLGSNVVYSTGLEADAQKYVEMASGKQ